MTTRGTAALTAAMLLVPLPLRADDQKVADPDRAVQGEYQGTLRDNKVGVHIIAEGDGKFALRAYMGGLPGDGWDGKSDLRATGKTADGKVTFEAEGRKVAVIADGKLTAHEGSQEAATFERVERKSPTLGMKPPEGAVVLFDGTNTDAWVKGKMTADKLLTVSGTGGVRSKEKFLDCTMHIEFRLPFMPKARGQGRANSGVYLQDRYECQVLDSFGLKGENNECGGFYQLAAPKVNMCLPPEQWQTYDIDFTAAKFEGDKKVKKAVVTVKHNGVVIHDKYEFPKITPGGGVSKDDATPGALYFQDHGNPVVFRNVWVVKK